LKQQRKTRQRQLVLDAVRARCAHPSADQIYLDVRAVADKISRGTVYRNLNFLTRKGEILHVKLTLTDRFEARVDMHYHLLCTGCGVVCDVPLPYNRELDKQAAEKTGYTVDRHRSVFEGLCPNCRQKRLNRTEGLSVYAA
jgi:Fe2+ or Zn2+ uptake regulation protein